jgi:multidrug efflux system membrane fusion protein
MRVTLTCLLTVATCVSCGESKTQVQVVRPVRTVAVQINGPVQQRVFGGVSKAGVESRLSFRVAGTIISRPVKVGDVVKKGTVIASLDPHDYDLQVEEAEAAVLNAEAQERHAMAQYDRVSNLYETESASRSELDAARAQAESAKATREAIQKKLELAKAQLDYTTLKATKDGTIAAVDIEEGENVAAGQPVVRLNAGESMEVTVSIPESLISSIREDDLVSVSFDSKPGLFYPAVVTEVGVSRQLAPAYPVKVQLLRHVPDMRSGMSAEVRFNFPTAKNDQGIVIPPMAVAEQDGKQYVWVVSGISQDVGKVERRSVAVNNISGDGLAIKEGLKPGDVVVTAGQQFLVEGQQVRVMK